MMRLHLRNKDRLDVTQPTEGPRLAALDGHLTAGNSRFRIAHNARRYGKLLSID